MSHETFRDLRLGTGASVEIATRHSDPFECDACGQPIQVGARSLKFITSEERYWVGPCCLAALNGASYPADAKETNQWTCLCGYMNSTEICTHCFELKPAAESIASTPQADEASAESGRVADPDSPCGAEPSDSWTCDEFEAAR